MFWIMAGALMLMVAVAVARPLLGQRGDSAPAAAYDLRVYRDQLREVDRDLERGIIAAPDADRLRAEIGRKVLDADRRLQAGGAAQTTGRPWWALAVLAAILAGAVPLYWREGAPGAPDLPLSARITAAENAYAARPTQAEAAAATPPRAMPDPDPQLADLMTRLRAAVAQRPDDVAGLALLARNELRLGNVDAALAAQTRLVEIKGDAASADDLAELAGLYVQQAGGVVTATPEALLSRALAIDPDTPQALYLVGLLYAQNGRPDKTFPVWDRLLRVSPPDAGWLNAIRQSMPDLAWLAGQPNYTPPGAATPPMAGLPGPDADAVAAAQDMSAEDQQAMIASMVERLEDRLATEGGSPQEWARLISSLAILGRTDHARDILAEATTRFGNDPQAFAPVQAAAQQAGLAP